MNYFVLNFSGPNEVQPRCDHEFREMREAGLLISHEYGMSWDGEPKTHCDHYVNCRTTLTQQEVEDLLEKIMGRHVWVTVGNPERITIRHKTVREELDAEEKQK